MRLLDNTLLAEQLLREKKMSDDGSARYLNRQEKHHNLSNADSHQQVIIEAVETVATALRNSIVQEQSKGSGRKHLWCTLLEDLDADALAYIGLNEMMDAAGNNATLTTCVVNIGERIETEVWAKELSKVSKKYAADIQKEVTKEFTSEWERLRAVKSLASERGFRLAQWDKKKCTVAAMPIVNTILESAKVFYVHEEYSKNNTTRNIRILGNVQDALANQLESQSWQQPMFSAMLIKPNPWTAIDTGCYMDESLSRHVPLVKGATYSQKQTIKRDFEKAALVGEVPRYVQAVNALQEVPLKINQRLLEAVKWCWAEGKTFGKFPSKNKLVEPDRLENWGELDKKQQQRHVSHCKKVRQSNVETNCAMLVMARDLTTASDLATFDEFYLPWNLDSRGRCYSVSTFNYHRDDHIKSLFLLANGTAVCDETDGWLMIHITNLGDFGKASKLSLEGRIDWFKENEGKILEVIMDVEGTYDFWSSADKPLQFLAACLEWGQYKVNGNGYVCHIAPALDGSNSGCQHYSAASRSATTGKLVNLVPTDVPQDVYQTLADKVNAALNDIIKDSSAPHYRQKMARLWLGYGVDRKTLKTNCMTYVYSSVAYGFGDQIQSQVMDEITSEILHSDGTREHPFGSVSDQELAARFLAEISFSCVEKVLVSAKEGMEFFRACAGALAAENKPMSWTTPIGFPVTQKYTKWNTKKVKVYLYDRVLKSKKRSQFSLKVDVTDEAGRQKIDVKKAKSGISPNIIHSMDSAHLLNTVLALKEQGIDDFMMIHDSFAVLPAFTPDLFDIVRETFINQYDDYCMYEAIYKSTQQQLSNPDAIKDLQIPQKGSLDLTLVSESDYCFA